MAEEQVEQTWFPPNVRVLAGSEDTSALVVVSGESGVGKSHLGYQLLRDPDYGPERVGFIMSEKSLATYDTEGARYNPVRDLQDAGEVIDSYKRAHAAGKRIPEVLFYDSLTTGCDYQMQTYRTDSPFVGRSGVRDKLAEYGDLGEKGFDRLANLRNELPCDIVVVVRTREGGGRLKPELALPGKIIPDNLTGWSDVSLYMKAEWKKATEEEFAAIGPNLDKYRLPHRTFGTDETGKWDGVIVQRFFYTQNNGEVLAKAHHSLLMKERAILPDVLRKIHGKAPRY